MAPSAAPDTGRDRRRYPRFRAARDVFAVLGNRQEKIGQVFDISRGGLSFRYLEQSTAQDETDSIDLFSPREKILLENVPVRTIADFAVDPHIPFSSIPVRQRSVQFLDVKPPQKRVLEHFLRHHTVSAAS